MSGLYFLLGYAVIIAAGSYRRADRTHEDPGTILVVILNCSASYALILLQTLALATPVFAPLHLVAALVYLGLAVAFWRREASRIATFFYAMTGYLALSAAIIKIFPAKMRITACSFYLEQPVVNCDKTDIVTASPAIKNEYVTLSCMVQV